MSPFYGIKQQPKKEETQIAKMRKCCCCISVHIGAALLGTIGFIICAAEIVVLIPYLLNVTDLQWNPIQKNLDQIFFILDSMLKEQGDISKEEIQQIIDTIKIYLWPTALGAAVEAGVYGLCCILMISGSQCKVRGLMVPYMVLQMLCIVIMMLIGVGVTIGLFFLNVIMGVVSGVVVLILALLMIYFWVAVQRAYVELGNRDYMYSPAPVKPSYTNSSEARGGYYPQTPQHFQMDEHK